MGEKSNTLCIYPSFYPAVFALTVLKPVNARIHDYQLLCVYCKCAWWIYDLRVNIITSILIPGPSFSWMVNFHTPMTIWEAGCWFNKNMLSYPYRKSHCGDKTILRPSYLHNGISYTGKTTYFFIESGPSLSNSHGCMIIYRYWIGALECKIVRSFV